MTLPVTSSARLPGYGYGPQDQIWRVVQFYPKDRPPIHPAHAKMVASITLDKESINLWANPQSGVTVIPQKAASGQTDLEGWGRQTGYVRIVATHRRRIDGLSVKLVIRQSLAFPQDNGRREVDEIVCREITYHEESTGGVWLEKGLNTFEFILHVPPDTSVQVVENGVSRIGHHVMATAIGSAKGFFGKDMMATQVVYLMAAPCDTEDLIFHHHSANFHESLGPCSVEASSHLLTVGGALFLSVVLASPPSTLRVYALRASLNQTTEITSHRDPAKTASSVKKTLLLEKGWAGPYTNKALETLRREGGDARAVLFDATRDGPEGYALEEMTRLPVDNTVATDGRSLRASTYPETRTCIRTTSELVVDLYFTIEAASPSTPPRLQIAQLLKKPVNLSSCGCMPGRLSLPDYAPTPDRFEPLDVRVPCLCDESTEKILEAEWRHARALRAAAALGQVGEGEGGGAVSNGRKVGEIRDT